MKNFSKKIRLPKNWQNALNEVTNSYSLEKILSSVNEEILKGKEIYPPIDQIFRAFECCPFSSTKVVIFGQDPYFQKGLANGLAFSVEKNQSIPPSLKNIYKELENDLGGISNLNGCLKNWALQGVLLLNTSLTVEKSKPGSHSQIGWEYFIQDVLDILNTKNNIVYFLWGSNAQKYSKFINKKNNLILQTSHPSPLSAYRGFFGSKHFSKCNNYLKKNNIEQISW